MKSWLAQGSSVRRVTLLPETTFLHINGALILETHDSSRRIIRLSFSSCSVKTGGLIETHYPSETKIFSESV